MHHHKLQKNHKGLLASIGNSPPQTFKEEVYRRISLVEGRDLSSFSIRIRGKEGKAHIVSTFLDHFSLEILIQRNAGEMSGEKRRGDVEGKREEKAEGEGERRHRVDTQSKKERRKLCVSTPVSL